uniref:Uncharacterized protein n=1 Tax=Acrobeloides nanus TaxID=290746 RepID=A0A914D2B8_9BILA
MMYLKAATIIDSENGNKNNLRASNNSSNGSGSQHKESLFYSLIDRVLMLFQRFLLGIMVICGYDIYSAHDRNESWTPIQCMVRIIRNFYYITKSIRLWLAINFNDGIVPAPAISKPNFCSGTYRSTPRNTPPKNMVNESLLNAHSPIKHCYSVQPKSYSLRDIWLGKRIPICNKVLEDQTDVFLNTSMSFSALLQDVTKKLIFESFLGYVEDPEVEKEENAPDEPGSDAKPRDLPTKPSIPVSDEKMRAVLSSMLPLDYYLKTSTTLNHSDGSTDEGVGLNSSISR